MKIYLSILLLLFSNSHLLAFDNLSLEEKVGQLLIVSFYGEEVNDNAKKLIQEAHIGGVVYYPFANGLTSKQQVRSLSEDLQLLSPIPLFIAVDQEGGRVAMLKEGFTQFPSQNEQATQPNCIRQNAYINGNELKAAGINMNFSPVVDVNINPKNPIIGNRSYGEDPYQVSTLGALALKGYQEAGIIGCLKHFPGHGDVEIDSHLDLPIVTKQREELDTCELLPFKKLHSQTDLIMTGHLLFPALDDKPATLSSKILKGILRDELGYQGVVISDSLIMQGLLIACPSLEEAALQALQAGCDLLCISGRIVKEGKEIRKITAEEVVQIHSYLCKAVEENKISTYQLDKTLQRIYNLKKKYNLIPQ